MFISEREVTQDRALTPAYSEVGNLNSDSVTVADEPLNLIWPGADFLQENVLVQLKASL